MCGIAGWVGTPARGRELELLLIELLERLEYRGYDSAGLWTPRVGLVRAVGDVGKLRAALQKRARKNAHKQAPVDAQNAVPYGIAHTRWATHGRVRVANTHPHRGCKGRVVLVHNGVIENVQELKALHPCAYRSETDSEVIAHLIEAAWGKGISLEEAVRQAVRALTGSYAIVVASREEAGTLVVAAQKSPLVVGCSRAACAVASDAQALAPFFRRVAVVPDGAVLTLTKQGAWERGRRADLVFEQTQTPSARGLPVAGITLRQRGHRMLQEMLESPRAWRNAVRSVVATVARSPRLQELLGKEAPFVWIPASCGSAWYATLAAAEPLWEAGDVVVPLAARESARVLEAMRFARIVLAVSQSGETADTREVVRAARAARVPSIGIVNMLPSSLGREVEVCVPLGVGPEVSVASTKAVVGQVAAVHTLGRARLLLRQGAPLQKALRSLREVGKLERELRRFLESQREEFRRFGRELSRYPSSFFIGAGAGEALAKEGALKLKEISYRHAEGMHAAELKHGPLAVVDERVPVVVVLLSASDSITLSNASEAHARGAPLFLLAPEGASSEARELTPHILPLPARNSLAALACALVALHFIAYEAAAALGRPIDRPRNLAKSVTVP